MFICGITGQSKVLINLNYIITVEQAIMHHKDLQGILMVTYSNGTKTFTAFVREMDFVNATESPLDTDCYVT